MTEEYVINVVIGTQVECEKENKRYLGHEMSMKGFRGLAHNGYPEKGPLIVIDSSLSPVTGLATLAHEASHAMDYIQSHVRMCDQSGEFHAHGIAAVMRAVGKTFIKKL